MHRHAQRIPLPQESQKQKQKKRKKIKIKIKIAQEKTILNKRNPGNQPNYRNPGNQPNSAAGTAPENENNNSANSAESERRLVNIRIALESAFRILDTDFSLSVSVVKKTYRKKALTCHPDKGGDPETFKILGAAVNKIVITINAFLGKFPELDPERANSRGG